MRIALVHYSYLPVIGGVETVMAEHARLFAEAGHEVTIVCKVGVSEDLRISVQRLEAAATLLARQEVVIVHNVLTMPFDLALTDALWELARELSGVRFICWVHDLAACNPHYEVDPRSRLAQAHERFEYVAISEHRRRQFENLTRAPCRVIPNGIDPVRFLGLTDRVAALAQECGLLRREIVLLHPARLLPRKNVELSLRVTAALRAAGHDCALLLTGPPDAQSPASAGYAESIRALRSELGLERAAIILHDRFAVTPADLSSLFAVADALFFPSQQEGFGLPVLEAALHRLPVFCADIEPMNSLLERHLHTFAADASAGDIAALIARHVAQCRLTQARKSAVRDHAWDVIFQKFLAPLLAEASSLAPRK